MSDYQPELGQLVWGQPHNQFSVPDIMDAALEYIDGELCRVMRNLHQCEYASPFRNTGAQFKELAEFQIEAYSWGDDDQPWNFKCGPVEIKWYKYLGRGMSANVEITPDMAAEILRVCLTAIREYEAREEGKEG